MRIKVGDVSMSVMTEMPSPEKESYVAKAQDETIENINHQIE